MTAFQLWMLVHAVRNGEWLWAVFIFIGWGVSAVLYYFFVYRNSVSATRGFELPGAQDRKRIKQLQAQIHHLDNASRTITSSAMFIFNAANSTEAEKIVIAPRWNLTRRTLTRGRIWANACCGRNGLPRRVRCSKASCTKSREHDYDHTMMALAETLTALGEETDNALLYWQHITQTHSYPRAKVQMAELYLAKNQPDLARAQLKDVLSDDVHAPAFQRKRDRVWVRRARSLMGKFK